VSLVSKKLFRLTRDAIRVLVSLETMPKNKGKSSEEPRYKIYLLIGVGYHKLSVPVKEIVVIIFLTKMGGTVS
jgi:hypothetical protein